MKPIAVKALVLTALGILLSSHPLPSDASDLAGSNEQQQTETTSHSCGQKQDVLRILTLGDSMTAGEGTSRGAYRGELSEILANKGLKIQFVGSLGEEGSATNPPHEGWVGYEVRSGVNVPPHLRSELYGGVTERAITRHAPDIVIILAGADYLCCSRDLPVLPDRFDMETRGFISKVTHDLQLLISQIYGVQKNTKIVVVGLPPSPAIHPDYVDLFNNGMEEPPVKGLREVVDLFKGEGRSIVFVEEVERKLIGPRFFEDELHLSDEGYDTLAESIADALQAALL